jgi:hypothetical protein
MSYRRGYWDGYGAAVHDLSRHASLGKRLLDRLCKFLNSTLMNWRLDARSDRANVAPPALPTKAR